MSEHLFTLPTDAFAVTSDDCYTPRWVFDAMGLRVAAEQEERVEVGQVRVPDSARGEQ